MPISEENLKRALEPANAGVLIMKSGRCYKVKVRATNFGNSFKAEPKEFKSTYFNCEDGELFVVTDNPSKIYETFGADVVVAIIDIGVGFVL